MTRRAARRYLAEYVHLAAFYTAVRRTGAEWYGEADWPEDVLPQWFAQG